jgi:hypothetical protein
MTSKKQKGPKKQAEKRKASKKQAEKPKAPKKRDEKHRPPPKRNPQAKPVGAVLPPDWDPDPLTAARGQAGKKQKK